MGHGPRPVAGTAHPLIATSLRISSTHQALCHVQELAARHHHCPPRRLTVPVMAAVELEQLCPHASTLSSYRGSWQDEHDLMRTVLKHWLPWSPVLALWRNGLRISASASKKLRQASRPLAVATWPCAYALNVCSEP